MDSCNVCGRIDKMYTSLICSPCYTTSSMRVRAMFEKEDKEQALRFNEGKVDYTLLPPKALEEEAKVWMHGEKKYGRNNWQKLYGPDTVQKVMASLLRHAMAIQNGEQNDAESGLSHASHIRCNAAMLIEFYSRQK